MRLKERLLILTTFFFVFSSISFGQEPWWFVDNTEESGLTNVLGAKTYVSDINGDGWPDLITISGTDYFNNPKPFQVWINTEKDGKRSFVDQTEYSQINQNRQGSLDGKRATAIALADVDNDGDKDIITGIYFHRVETSVDNGDRMEILLNNGNGKFDVLLDNGLENLERLNTQGMSYLDFDKDGNIDIFLGNWSTDHSNNQFQRDVLLKGNGDGSFIDYSVASGLNSEPAEPLYGSNVGDINNDGNTDIFTAPYCRTGGRLWQNNGDQTFTNISENAGYDAQLMTGDNEQALCMWAAYPCDYDNDRDLDLFFTLVHGGLNDGEGRSTIVQNQGEAMDFSLEWKLDLLPRDAPRPSHQADYEAAWTDFDNDGLTDLLVGQGTYPGNNGRVYLFRQKADHSFEDITFEVGLNKFKYIPCNRVRTCDYDRDGDEDLILSTQNGNDIKVIRNDIGNYNKFIAFEITGKSGVNKDAIGTKVELHYENGIVQTKEIYAGEGNASGQNDLIVHFGIAQTEGVDSVVFTLPDAGATRWVLENPEVNKIHAISESNFVPDTEDYIFIYPNPVEDNLLQITSSIREGNMVDFQITDLLGKTVKLASMPASAKYNIDLSDLKPGAYIVSLSVNGERKESKKFLKF